MRSVAVLVALSLAGLLAQTPVVTWSGPTQRLASASVAPGSGGGFRLTLAMADDNGNGALPTTWRRWWHCEVGNLSGAGTPLDVRVTNAGYSDVILPVWSLSADGTTFGAYQRLPTSAVPTVVGSTEHRFSVVTPPGVVAIRLAKYFPYSVADKDALLASLAGEPRVRSVATIGSSLQGRPVEKIELTDGSVPDAQKQRVWIHAGIHPAETTGYFVVEGLLAWLTSGDPFAEALLDQTLVEIVPMANPDSVFLGNYRTNAASSNLEAEWSAPYASPQPEVAALRTAIEGYMGTVASPAPNPIRVLLNLHATHNVAFPFHFRHVANASWTPGCSSCGVIPLVHQLESDWIQRLEQRSALVALGTTQNSTLGSRPFVESMMHDRWTAVPGWLGAPAFEEAVMAITFEGTYGRGPDGVAWNTPDDWRRVGREMGRALFDHLGLSLAATATNYGQPCVSASLSATLGPQPDGSHVANLTVVSAAPNGLAVLAVGGQPLAAPLPPPWLGCTLLASPDATALLPLGPVGIGAIALPVPALSGLVAHLQAHALDFALTLDASNGVVIANGY